MDQETHPGNHREHGQRQAIQYQIEADIEITNRHPVPQRYADRLLTIGEEINANKNGCQCS